MVLGRNYTNPSFPLSSATTCSPLANRPTCSRCQNLRTDCHYEAEEGESRWSALRRRNQVLEAERDHIRELMHFVQSRPEVEAQELFQRIRTTNYDDLFLLLRQFKEAAGAGAGVPTANMGLSPSIPHGVSTATSVPMTQSVDQRLPPIQTILDPGARSYPPGVPPTLVHSQSLSSEESRGSSAGMDLPTMPNAHQQMQQRQLLDTLEPSLRPQPGDHPRTSIRGTPQLPTLSSEESRESTGSMGSTSKEPPKPYTTSP